MFKLRVERLGPIKEANASPRPLTIFVGPNNVGKSYLAVLLYAIYHTIESLPPWFWIKLKDIEKIYTRAEKTANKIRFGELIKKPQLREAFQVFVSSLYHELRRCFASEISDLKSRHSKRPISFRMEHSGLGFHLEFEFNGDKSKIRSVEFGKLENLEIDLSRYSEGPFPREIIIRDVIPRLIISKIIDTPINVYYFPAARSGILQAHKLVASSIVKKAPLAGVEPLEIPPLSGIVADFISYLLQLRPRVKPHNHAIEEVAEFLESEVTKGSIGLKPTEIRFEYPEIYYESIGIQLPLHRSSSMVSELAPLVLFFKHVIQKGDLLIIEEPEAHLHPDNQLKLAQAIVKLIRRGVRVLITTHSDYLVHQLNNFIRLSQIPDRAGLVEKLKYDENDYLNPEEVAAYLFYFDKTGIASSVKELEISKEDGIPEDAFTQIAEQLYQTTVKLSRLINRK